MRGSNKMKRGGTEWHLEQEDNDSKYEGDGGSGYDWRRPDSIYMVSAKVAFDTLDMPDSMKDLHVYRYSRNGCHYFRDYATGETIITEEVPDE